MKMNVDSDSEVSSDPEVSSVQLPNALTRSVFNITLDIPGDETTENNERTDYEKRLNAEIDEWLSLLKRTKQTVSNSSSDDRNIDYSVLSAENLAYLRRAPDLSKFIEDSIAFRKEAKVYLEVDYDEILEEHNNLTELCKSRLNTKKSQLIEENIFNNPRLRREIN